ncbi:MAG: glycosyltransferase family 39 protein, partial [Chloroflexi bacterium]|nr:glycosyltransferase family 39 protein [Chloroflexota bacterium]
MQSFPAQINNAITRAAVIIAAFILAALAAAFMAGRLTGGTDGPAWGGQTAIGAALLLVGMALFAWAAPRPILRRGSNAVGASPRFAARPRVFMAAMAAYLFSLTLYALNGESNLVRGLWLASMALVVIAHIDRWRWPKLSREDGRDWLLLTLITFAGFALRFWRLFDLPGFVHGDISSQGLEALAILSGAKDVWFGVGWSDFPMLDYVIMAGTMKLLGRDLFGLSMTAVWQGALTLPALYLLGREMFGRRVGLIAAALLAISYTHIHFSRFVSTASPVLAITLTFFFLFRGLRLRRPVWFGLAGVMLGMGMMLYYSFRSAAVIAVLLLLWLLIWQRDRVKAEWRNGVTMVIAALVGFGPMLVFALENFRSFVGRGNLVTLFNPQVMQHLMNKYGAQTVSNVWWEQTKRTLLTFFSYGDASTHFAFPGPIVSTLTAVLFTLGLAYALRHVRDERSFVLVVWVVLVLLLGSIVTNDAPFWPHIIIVLPAVALLAAWAAERAWSGLSDALPEAQRARANWALGGLLALLIALTGVKNWQAYVAHVEDNATPELRIARFLAALPSDRRVVLVKDPYDWERREFRFFGRHLQGADFPADYFLSNSTPEPQVPTVFIITPNHPRALEALKTRFPNAPLQEHVDGRGVVAFYSLEVMPPAYISPPDAAAPLDSLPVRQRLVWGLAILLFIAALVAGVYLYLRRPPAPSPAPSLAPSSTQPP